MRSTDCLVLRQHVLHHRDVGVSKDTQPCVLVLFGGDGKHAPVWLLREREAVQNQSFREPHMFFFKRQSQCRFALRLRCQEVYCALRLVAVLHPGQQQLITSSLSSSMAIGRADCCAWFIALAQAPPSLQQRLDRPLC